MPPIIRDPHTNKCVECRRFICLVNHKPTEEVAATIEQKVTDEFTDGFLL